MRAFLSSNWEQGGAKTGRQFPCSDFSGIPTMVTAYAMRVSQFAPGVAFRQQSGARPLNMASARVHCWMSGQEILTTASAALRLC